MEKIFISATAKDDGYILSYRLRSVPCITLFPFTFLIANQPVPSETPILYHIFSMILLLLFFTLLLIFFILRLSYVYCSFRISHLYFYYARFSSQCGDKAIFLRSNVRYKNNLNRPENNKLFKLTAKVFSRPNVNVV